MAKTTVRELLTEALRGFSFLTDGGNIVVSAAPDNVADALESKGWHQVSMYSIGWRLHVRFEKKYHGELAATDLVAETPFQVRLMKSYGY